MTTVNNERVLQIVEALVTPNETDPVRYNNDASSQATACKALTQDFKINWNTATVDKSLPATDTACFLFRNAARAVIIYDNNPTNQLFSYDLGTFNGVAGATVPVPFRSGTCTTTYQPHGPVVYPCLEDGRTGFWLDEGTAYEVTFTGTLTGIAGGQIMQYLWNGNQWEWFTSQVLVNGTATYTSYGPSIGGSYVALEVVLADASTSDTFSVKFKLVNTGYSVWRHLAVPQLEQLSTIVQGVRVLAASINWENYGSDLEESGKVVAVNIAPGQFWRTTITSQSSLTQLAGYKSSLAKNGYYGFLKIDDESDLNFSRDVAQSAYIDSPGGLITYPLRERSSFLAVSFSIASTSSRDTSVTITHSLEYRTNSKIQETRVPYTPGVYGFTYDEWTRAIQLLAHLPQHHSASITFKKVLEQLANKRARV